MAAQHVQRSARTPDPGRVSEPGGPDAPRAEPRVFLHIGEPKTGTTFLQQVLWRNRTELAACGVVLPGHHPQDQYRASQDLRGIQKPPADPVGAWTGEWDILASQARQAPKIAIISHELFSAADAAEADHAVRSLQPAQVHIVLTVRDMATLLPAEWQETVKHRNDRGWEDWLGDVIDRESFSADRRQWWFWRVHDTIAVLDVWSRLVPPERVHVIMTPPRGSAPGVLWQRFASVLDIDPGSVDLSRARPNSSLGVPETEFVRRLNQVLPPEVPDWFYMRNFKEVVAHRTLAARPRGGGLALPGERQDWATKQAEVLITALRDSGYDLVGDTGELLPAAPAAASTSSPAGSPPEQVLDAAVDAAAALLVHHYRRAHPAARPQRGPAAAGGLVRRVESTVVSSPRFKRTVRDLSSRFPAVRQLRILAWRATERRRMRRHR